MGGWCKERYNKDENKLEGLHQKPDQMEETRWEEEEEVVVVVVVVVVVLTSVSTYILFFLFFCDWLL
jgi:hypothetical protein